MAFLTVALWALSWSTWSSPARAADDAGKSPATSEPSALQRAGKHFERGKKLYANGRYKQALVQFEAANRIARHSATLFNIARCYQNLGELDQALTYLRQALAISTDDAQKRALRRRIADIEARPVDVLINTDPQGARVTIDARAQPQPRATPLVIRLTPGAHVLTLRRDGHQLAVARVVAKHGGPRATVDIKLRARARPGAAPPPVVRREPVDLA
ncbi:MAG: tetratricopeptide repeat protein, partial [Myxococcales bacterium]|nr:tetratricopeptide repeat protein [Myxococcales bacterium]